MLEGETTMVSDQEIAKGVDNILRHSDPNAVNYSVNGVVQQLGAKLGLDLSHKAGFIRDQINRHLRQYPPQPPPSLLYQTQQHGAIKERFAVQHNHYHQQAPSPHQFHHSLFQQQPQPLPHQQQPFPPHFALHFPGSFRGQVISSPTSSVPQLHQHQPTTQFQFQAQPNVRAHIQPGRHVAPGVAAEKSPKESGSAGTKKRGGAGGLNKVCGVSPELQAVVGESALPRTEIVKQLWAYIRKNNLQDPSNKRKIICDDALRAVFEIDCTDMFKMNKLLSKHIIPLGSPKESAPVKRMKVEVEPAVEITEPTQNVDPKETTQNVTPQETSKESPVIISDTLAAFLGTTSREMLQSDATKQVLEYIRINHLEDLNSMKVVCDAKLRELFGAESVPSAGIADMLARHHLFTSS